MLITCIYSLQSWWRANHIYKYECRGNTYKGISTTLERSSELRNISLFFQWCLMKCFGFYLPSFLFLCLRTSQPALIPLFMPACLPDFLLHASFPACVPSVLHTCLLPAFIVACLSSQLSYPILACLHCRMPPCLPVLVAATTTCLCSCTYRLPAFLVAWLFTCLPFCMPPYLPLFLPTRLPVWLVYSFICTLLRFI